MTFKVKVVLWVSGWSRPIKKVADVGETRDRGTHLDIHQVGVIHRCDRENLIIFKIKHRSESYNEYNGNNVSDKVVTGASPQRGGWEPSM